MNDALLKAMMPKSRRVDPPGCVSTYVEHPNPQCREHAAAEVGFVMEHRFAFYYWIKAKQDWQRKCRVRDDSQFTPPDLITWDWHDDCGADGDVVEEQLAMLNQSDETEVSLFSWLGLSGLDDGQILPAVWLNAIGNVYIIQKQRWYVHRHNRTFNDRFGHDHQIFYFRHLSHFPKTFRATQSCSGIIWDIDLDFFTERKPVPDQKYTPTLSSNEIRSMLDRNSTWMPLILRDLRAITIALEPQYTGGLSVSLDLYNQWERSLFKHPLFSRQCRWQDGLLPPDTKRR